MANLDSIARPYALAAFESARDKQQLPAWKAFLESAAHIAKDPAVSNLLATPELNAQASFMLFNEILDSLVDAERKNFLRLLTQNKRLNVLPEIADLFNSYYAALEKMSNVRIVTAVAIESPFQQKLTQALTKRIQHEVTLHCEVDPAIIGGAIIHLGGNKVIDGSIRGKLTRLREALAG
jgi:F-type H+-transporting ATPase subunit delta